MISLPDDVPTIMSYHRFLYDVALPMPQMHDDLSDQIQSIQKMNVFFDMTHECAL
jgi:hypothetical protein